jgi:NADH-quinone oxidoreductase subunit F/NADP-reducing hydrogenase subunit HndC
MSKQKVFVCTKGKTCRKRGAREVFCALEQEIEAQGLEEQIKLKKTECMGHCGKGPTVKIKPDKVWYGSVSPRDCAEIIRSLLAKTPISRLRLKKA